MHQEIAQSYDVQMDGTDVQMGGDGSKADLVGTQRSLSLEKSTHNLTTLTSATKDDTVDKEAQHPIKRGACPSSPQRASWKPTRARRLTNSGPARSPACLACRARKTRCNGLDPCQHVRILI